MPDLEVLWHRPLRAVPPPEVKAWLLNALRVGEACAATVEDLAVVRGHRVLRRVRGKGGRLDVVPLAPRTTDAIDAHLAGRVDGPLLQANDGGPLDRHDAARIVRRLVRAVGITDRISPHSLWHTGITLALDAGGYRCATCRTWPATSTRGRLAGTTRPGRAWTGTRPTRWPGTSPTTTVGRLPELTAC